MFYIESIILNNFRNYRDLNISFHPRLNYLLGDNAQGKTNLLESIFFLSVNKSFRTSKDKEMLSFDSKDFFIKGVFVKDNFKHNVSAGYNLKDRFRFKVNSKQVKRHETMHGFPVIIFSPADLQIISEGPSVRRKFLNLAASRFSVSYFNNLKNYQKVLNHRNALLKDFKIRHRINELIVPWDHSLITLGVKITRKRIEMIQLLENKVQDFFSKITYKQEKINLDYKGSVTFFSDEKEMVDNYYKKLLDNRCSELKRCSTLQGPHLDDLIILIDGVDSRRYSSQGQKRTASLAMKLGELSLLEDKTGLSPIILLDDVFSEFDDFRKKYLLEYLKDSSSQCFITSAANLNRITEQINLGYKITKVQEGRIIYEASRAGS